MVTLIRKVFYNRITRNYLLLFCNMFLVEIIFKMVLKIPVMEWSLLRIFLSISLIAMVLSGIYSFFGNLLSDILTGITCFIVSLYAILQAGFYNFLGVFISIGTRSQLGAVKDYIKDYLDSFLPSFYLIFIPFLFTVLYYIIIEKHVLRGIKNLDINFSDKYNTVQYKKMEEDNNRKKKKRILKIERLCIIVFSIVFSFLYYYSLNVSFMQNDLQLKSNKELFFYPDMPNLAVAQFGVTSYGLIDVESTFLPRKQQVEEEYLTYTKPEPQPVTDYSRLIDDTAWESWAASTNNPNYQKLNNYYLSKNITSKNDYTGLFKGKNLIVIMMESTNNIVLDERYYPNINKLAKNGWNFTNSFSPRNSCSTGNNEMSGMVSLFTINNICTANSYSTNVYPQALFNLFNNVNYKTSSYHNFNEHYYFRKTIHPNMGSQSYSNAIDLEIPYNDTVYEEWPSDVELMEKVLQNIDSNEPFMAWITTVSAHQPYTVSSKLGDLNTDLFKDNDYNISLKRYMSKLKVFDDSIGTLIAGLEEKGILDNTVIVLYADHYPYGLSNNTLNKYFDYDVNENNEVDRTPFIIYNPTLTAATYSQYTSYMNIVPTLANLFDLDYDPRLYSGYDVFSDDYKNRVVFADGSWQDDVAFYNATTSKISYYGDSTYETEYIKEINKEISTNIKMANNAITYNYFKALFEGKEKFANMNVALNSENEVIEKEKK